MINAGVMDGDYVVVRQQNTADNGDMIVAMTPENEATVKRFYKEKDRSDYSLKTIPWNRSGYRRLPFSAK